MAMAPQFDKGLSVVDIFIWLSSKIANFYRTEIWGGVGVNTPYFDGFQCFVTFCNVLYSFVIFFVIF